jgi:hypothetical protein
MLLAGTTPAAAQMISSTVPVEVLAAGGHCETPPDEIVAAPGAGGGAVLRNNGLANYVILGDRFPAQVELGIGILVRIAGYGPGRIVTVRIVPPVGNTGEWKLPISEAGDLDFGRLPAIGEPLPQGQYLLSVLDDDKVLFTYAITIAGHDAEILCSALS